MTASTKVDNENNMKKIILKKTNDVQRIITKIVNDSKEIDYKTLEPSKIILSIISVLHAIPAFVLVVLGNHSALPKLAKWPNANDGIPLSTMEDHLIGVIGYCQLLLLVNNVCAIAGFLMTNDDNDYDDKKHGQHRRAMAMILELIFALGHTTEDIKSGYKPGAMVFVAILSMGGLLHYAQDVGIITIYKQTSDQEGSNNITKTRNSKKET